MSPYFRFMEPSSIQSTPPIFVSWNNNWNHSEWDQNPSTIPVIIEAPFHPCIGIYFLREVFFPSDPAAGASDDWYKSLGMRFAFLQKPSLRNRKSKWGKKEGAMRFAIIRASLCSKTSVCKVWHICNSILQHSCVVRCRPQLQVRLHLWTLWHLLPFTLTIKQSQTVSQLWELGIETATSL